MRLDKKQNRLRRSRKPRAKIRELGVNRLCIHRTPRHIYAQIISSDGSSVLVSASVFGSAGLQSVEICFYESIGSENIKNKLLSFFLVSASTLEKEVRETTKLTGNKAAAAIIGSRIAEKAKQAGIKLEVAFDRSGFSYHGRIKELADAARTSGLKF